MYDPMTLAFDIKYPWRRYPDEFNPKGYRASCIHIWHVDPESGGHHGNRGDDSCGWHTPPTTEAEREEVCDIGRELWGDLFRRRDQLLMGDPHKYAHVCYEPDYHNAIYYAWKAIRRLRKNFRPLTGNELQRIYDLANCPVDNLRVTIDGVQNANDCADFVMLVYRAYLRFNRPWYRHPKWHFWHWKVNVLPWQRLRRWLFTRCEVCGQRFENESPVSISSYSDHGWFEGEKGLVHMACSGISIPERKVGFPVEMGMGYCGSEQPDDIYGSVVPEPSPPERPSNFFSKFSSLAN